MASSSTPPAAAATAPGVADLLGPPLDVLPRSIEPQELHDYRVDYQAFRSGQAQGARGELADLRTRLPAPAPPPAERCGGQERRGPGAQARDRTTSSVACYYSEPERPTTPDVAGAADPGLARTSSQASQELPRTSSQASARVQELPRTSSQASARVQVAADAGPGPGGVPAAAPAPPPGFAAWLAWEVRSGLRADESQAERSVPPSHLLEVAQVPRRLEKLLGFGFLFCLDILLHELSFTPLQALRALPRALAWRRLRTTEQCDLLRLSLLLLNVALVTALFDTSWVYHFIRGQSFLKLYVSFNMLEMFERWCRSIGVDLINLLMTSMRDPWLRLLRTFATTLFYCLVHTTMHLLRVLLYHVAINTSSSAVLLIIVTNCAGEVKSTVFKRYKSDNLFPIITSDIVERFYLVLDIVCLLVRLAVSPHAQMQGVTFWIALLVLLELSTDWLKFCLIMKFSELPASTLEQYQEVLVADVLLCRSSQLPNAPRPAGLGGSVPSSLSMCGIHSFSHAPARRIGFSGVPLTSMVVLHLATLLRSPCALGLRWPAVAGLAGCVLLLAFLAKVLLGLCLLGFAARRRQAIRRGLELFGRVKAL